MEINVRTNISKEFNNIEITINAPEKTEQVIEIENALLNLNSGNISEIIGMQGNNLYIINISDVIKFYSEDKKNGNINEVIGMQGNSLYILNVSDIIKFYSDEKKNYCKTAEGDFIIKEKLYFLEDNLPNDKFIRISNSVIVNIEKAKCFDTSILGSIIIIFKDNTKEYVSKRRVSSVMKFLKDRRG